MSNMVKITKMALVPGSDRDVYITWDWDKENTDHYELRIWYLLEGISGGWEVDPDNHPTSYEKRYQYTAPENATKVTITVKPVSKTYKVNNTDTHYWTGEWSTNESYYFSNNPPDKPDAPRVELDNYTLTATLDPIPERTSHVIFMIFDGKDERRMGVRPAPTRGSVSCSYTVAADKKYKVRCYVYNDNWEAGEYSEYSGEIATMPAAPKRIETLKAKSSTSIYLSWSKVATADTYDVEYATKRDYLGTVDKSTTVSDIETTHHEFIGLETGSEYFFRVRAVNSEGESEWCAVRRIIIGKPPSAPTTWSSTTTAIFGKNVNLYWVHNTEDGSRQTYAEIEIDDYTSINTITIDDRANDENEDEEDVMQYSLDTSRYTHGAKIRWRVRTRGVMPDWSEWSIQRTIDIYAPPVLQLSVTDYNGAAVDRLTSFPMRVRGYAVPNTQTPLSYHLSIIANDSYQTIDHIGNHRNVSAGDVVYSKHLNTSDDLDVTISAGDVNLDNNVNYTIKCVVSMDSGLTAEDSHDFTVAWIDDQHDVNAEIGIDTSTYSAYIKPYCVDSKGKVVDNVMLGVYRREFDGKFTEIITGIENTNDIFVTDPHPSLDFARYRIVATSKTTGAVSYADLPGYPVACKSAILQWDDTWSNFNAVEGEISTEPAWSGSMLKLHYNIDVSEQTDPDVVHVKYIGREHPVGYYGTQVGQSASWSMVIPKSDKDTLYALRRLSTWMGNVYVREPSGTGYWATVNVSYNRKHKSMTIPVTLDITRVEGGV